MTTDHRFGQNFATFGTSSHVFAFRWTFQKKVAKSTSFRETGRKIIDFAKALQLFEQTTMFWHFHEVFSKKLQKVTHFVRKHEKSSIWSKLCNFGNKLPCLCISMNFSEKSCKKCLSFPENARKIAKSASFCEKARKIVNLVKTLQLWEQATMSLHFDELFRKKLQKVSRFLKTHEKCQNLQLFAFRWKSASFCFQLWEQATMSLHFDEQNARKIIEKLATFRKNYHVWRFDEVFSKKLQKVPHFVRKHEKSSIWSKLCNFGNKLPCLCISMNFSEKSCKKYLVSWNRTKNHRFCQGFATFRKNYHVSAFWSAFQQKVVKSIVGAYQAQAIITGFATSICSFHLCRDWGNDFWNYVSRSTGVLG